MKVYDLSVTIRNGAAWYGDECEPVKIQAIGSYEKEGWLSHTIEMMVLCGSTYIETAAHIYPDAPILADIEPGRFIRKAFIVRLDQGQKVLPAPKNTPDGFSKGSDALILDCGWDKKVNDPDYYWSSPYFSSELQEYILDLNPSILGGDMLSFDEPNDTKQPFIHEFFGRGSMILTPLCGLSDVPKDVVTLCAAPLKMEQANGAPCRAFCW